MYIFINVCIQVCIYLNRSRVCIYTHLQPVDGAEREVHTRLRLGCIYTYLHILAPCEYEYTYVHILYEYTYVQAVEGADRSRFSTPGTQPQISRKVLQPGAGLPGIFPSFFLSPTTTAASRRWNRENSFSNSSQFYTRICYTHI